MQSNSLWISRFTRRGTFSIFASLYFLVEKRVRMQAKYLFTQFWFTLLDCGNEHVTSSSGWQTIQTTTDAMNSDDIQVLTTWNTKHITHSSVIESWRSGQQHCPLIESFEIAAYLYCQRSWWQHQLANQVKYGIFLRRYHHDLFRKKKLMVRKKTEKTCHIFQLVIVATSNLVVFFFHCTKRHAVWSIFHTMCIVWLSHQTKHQPLWQCKSYRWPSRFSSKLKISPKIWKIFTQIHSKSIHRHIYSYDDQK